MRLFLRLLPLLVALASSAAQAQTEIGIGIAPVVPNASVFLAIEEGYLREAGFTARIERANSAATLIPFVASNRVQVIQGGISLGYFNAVAQGLPIIVTLDSGSSPINSVILVRSDIAAELKTPRDLKSKRVGIVAPGAIPEYVVGKVLESAGLTLKDIDIKYIPFQDMGPAFANNALDAALEVPPYIEPIVAQGSARRWLDPDTIIEPSPTLTVVYIINTDWAAQNQAAAHRLMLAFARAGREYCDAYHHGPNRAQVVDLLAKNKVMEDRELLDRMSWQARDPNGRVRPEVLADIQDFYFREGKLAKKAPPERLLDPSYADEAAAAFGPFTPKNASSTLRGCR
ncbi:MAG TPA: ABC transporter substrate-binding protein [Stellaceae bacterium]|nr:ABC transporter substrate-binding protein [Stellaceae bacterium]